MKVLRGRPLFIRILALAASALLLTGAAWGGRGISPEVLDACVRRVLAKLKPPELQPAHLLPAPEVLAAYNAMLTGEKMRTESDRRAIGDFKNDDSSPKEVDLLSIKLEEKSPELEVILQQLMATKKLEWHGGSERYRLTIMNLKKGDTIRAHDFSLTLGEYIGAGNMTHIFAVAGSPGVVVRIPFNIYQGHPWSSRRRLKEFVDMYPGLPKDVPHVVVEVVAENYAFATCSRVTGWVNGREFLDHPPAGVDAAWIAKSVRLKDLVHRVNTGRFSAEREKDLARQFLWDEEREDWILVDWEGLLSS